MKNSTDTTINGSKANSVNKRSVPVTAQLHEALFEETTAKKRRAVFSELPPELAFYAEIEGGGEEEEEAEGEEDVAEGDEVEEGEEEKHEGMASVNEDITGTNGRVSEGMTEKRSISMTLTDPDVFDCPICFISLTIPVFQCENGHIACASCSTNISNCPSCTCPIGNNRCRALEKVLESVEVPCPNARYGCNASFSYSKLRGHEPLCVYTPCSCPLRACKFLGFSKDLYTHFSSTHNSAKPVDFCSRKLISLKKNQRFLYLREKSEGIIFVVNHHFLGLGSAVNVICIAPGSSRRRFPYELVAMGGGGGTSIKLESLAENIPNWDPSTPLKTFLLVPRDITDSYGLLRFEVCIREW